MSRLSIVCDPCGFSVDTPDNDFGRAMIAAWPATHAKTCPTAKAARRAARKSQRRIETLEQNP